MPEAETIDNQQREAGASQWDALNYSEQFGDVDLIEKREESKQPEKDEKTKNEVEGVKEENTETTETKEEAKPEAKEETTPETKDEKTETETKTDETEKPKDLEFSVEDVGVKPEHEDGSWKKLSQELLGTEIAEDTFEALKPAFEAKLKEAENKGRAFSKDDLFATLDPKVAVTMKLMDAGLSYEVAQDPNGVLDANMALPDAELIRADLIEKKWDADKIDTHLEILSENPKRLAHEASLIRDDINAVKVQINALRQEKLQEYEQNKGKVAQVQAEAQKNQIIDSLKSVKEFMGGKVPDVVRDAVIQKINQGGYDNLFNDPAAKARFILSEILGEKAIKAKIDQAYQNGVLEKAKKLANVPPVDSKVAASKELKINQNNPWAALEKSEFGEK